MMHRLVGRIGIAFAASLLTLAAVELLVRVCDIGPTFQVVFNENYQLSSDRALGYELRPGSEFHGDLINTAGMRDREYPFRAGPDVFRIVAIGDSVTIGLGVSREDSYPEVLENLLNHVATDRGPTFEVLNLGVPGYNIWQSVAALRVRGLAFRPDVVVYGYVLNDLEPFSFEGEMLSRLAESVRDEQSGAGTRATRWLARSRLFLLVRHVIRDRRHPDPVRLDLASLPRDPAYATSPDHRERYFRGLHSTPEGRAELHAGLAELAALSRRAGVPVLIVVFPVFLDRSPYPLSDIHRDVVAEARQLGLHAVDLAPMFAEAQHHLGESLSRDFLHPDSLGHQLIALLVARELHAGGDLPAGSIDWSRIEQSPTAERGHKRQIDGSRSQR